MGRYLAIIKHDPHDRMPSDEFEIFSLLFSPLYVSTDATQMEWRGRKNRSKALFSEHASSSSTTSSPRPQVEYPTPTRLPSTRCLAPSHPASPACPARPPSPMPAMEYNTTTTHPRLAMENIMYSESRSRRISNNELPLVQCKECKCQILKVLTAKTDKNYDRQFYICSTRTVRTISCKFCVIC